MMGFEQDIEKALAILRQGGILLYPTDTIWGIGCDATNEEAVKRIFALKKRADSKALIVLVAEEKEIYAYTAAPDPALLEYLGQCNKPTTAIYEGALGLAENLIATDGSIGIRICQDPFCRALIKRLRKPLVSTSANLSGDKPPAWFGEIHEAIKSGVDYVVKYRQDDRTPTQASSVVRMKEGRLEVIRP